MKRLRWSFAVGLVLTGLFGCNGRNEGGGSSPVVPPGSSVPQPVNCDKYRKFLIVYHEMVAQKQALADIASRDERLALASGFLSSFLSQYSGYAEAMRSNSGRAHEIYLKSFSWIFNDEGFVRNQPNHPDARACSKGE